MSDLRVLVVAFGLDGTDVGEGYSSFQWVKALSERANLTVLSSSRVGARPLAQQLPNATVVMMQEPEFLDRRFARANAIVKPFLPILFRRARRWARQALARGDRFDIAHQLLPQAMRYAPPFRGLGIPYVVGPLGGGLSTPEAFLHEAGRAPFYTRLRSLDRARFRFDPWLRRGYAEAGAIIGVAPYVKEALSGIPLKRFEVMLERGCEAALPDVSRNYRRGRLSLLHVGRAVRTKGLRDMVRALAHLTDLPGVTLTSIGDGEDLDACRREAQRLGVSDKVRFLGRLPRADVDNFYASADVFAFPSFRESMGGVLFEAMSFGLPVITAARGGPDCIVDDSCGIRVPVTDPEKFAADIAVSVRRLANDPQLCEKMSEGARVRLRSFGNWADKAEALLALYREVIADYRG